MREIDLYLYHNKNLKSNLYLSKDSIDLRLIDVFKEICDFTISNKLTIVPISSSSVYPEIVKYNSKFYLLWDLCYFKLFDSFIYILGIWKEKNRKIMINSIILLLYDYLICKLDSIPELSLVLRKRKSDLDINIDSKIPKIDIIRKERYLYKDEISIGTQVRFLTFYHELRHILYKLNENELKKDLKKYGEIIERHFKKQDSLLGQLAGIKSLNLIPISNKQIEELACDEYALKKTEDIFVISMERKFGIEREICFDYVRESYWMNKMFFSYLTVLSDIYIKRYRKFKNDNYKVTKEEIYAPLIMRFESIPHWFLHFFNRNLSLNITSIQTAIMTAMNKLTENLDEVFKEAEELANKYDNPFKLKSMLDDID